MRTFGNYSQLGQQRPSIANNQLGVGGHASGIWPNQTNPFSPNTHSPYLAPQNQNIPVDRGIGAMGSQRSFVGADKSAPFYPGSDLNKPGYNPISASQPQANYNYGLN